MRRIFLLLATFLGGSLHAIPESDYPARYAKEVVPFLATGEQFTFRSADGKTDLHGIRFLHPNPKGEIVVVNGNTESWLKYGELFYDLYQHGFSISSYDHRGQGLSPRMVPANPQICQIDDFAFYAADLNAFVHRELTPGHHAKLYLLAHSMGGAVALDYLERYPSPFQAVVVSAPMLRINTAPYPETVTRGIVGFLHSIGLGDHYVIGKHDRYGDEPFEGNKLTSSKDRWNAIQSTWMNHPEAVTGGPSNDWVEQAIDRTAFIRARLSGIKSRVLILQAGKDEFVLNPDQDLAQEKIPGSRLTKFPDAHHEILFEKDPIRNQAITQILNFYGN